MHVHAEIARATARDGQHLRAQIDPHELHVAWIRGEVQPGADPELERAPTGHGTDRSAPITEEQAVVVPHPTVVALRGSVVEATKRLHGVPV